MKKEKVKKPNIIFVQLESHFDITQVKGVKFNKDPLPNFHKYMKGYSSDSFLCRLMGQEQQTLSLN